MLLRVFGAIPGPIILGAILDSGCAYWGRECGRRANCFVYNNSVLGYRAFLIAISGIFVSAVLFILCWIFYPPRTTCGKSEEQDDIDASETVSHTSVNGQVNKGFELEPQNSITENGV